MTRTKIKSVLAGTALVAACFAGQVFAKSADVDPQADKVLRAMTTYLAGLKQFSAQTENSIEVVTADGQKLQFVAPASVTVSRPDKLFAARRGDIVNQEFYYDGKSLTLYNPDTKYYATVAAPANVDDMLDFAQARLDIIAPAADLLDTRAYERLMQDATSGDYLGMSVVGGQRCHHLAYRAGAVDWQIWVRDGDQPLPCRYVITSTDIGGAPQFTMQVTDWDAAPTIPAGMFNFTPPAGAKAIDFQPAAAAAQTK
jgi:hypothetical protein